jgi:hypothetical protein
VFGQQAVVAWASAHAASCVAARKEPAERSGPPARGIVADTEGLTCGAAYFFLAAFFLGLALAAGFFAVVFLAIRVVLLPGSGGKRKNGQQRPPATLPDEVAQQHHALMGWAKD